MALQNCAVGSELELRVHQYTAEDAIVDFAGHILGVERTDIVRDISFPGDSNGPCARIRFIPASAGSLFVRPGTRWQRVGSRAVRNDVPDDFAARLARLPWQRVKLSMQNVRVKVDVVENEPLAAGNAIGEDESETLDFKSAKRFVTTAGGYLEVMEDKDARATAWTTLQDLIQAATPGIPARLLIGVEDNGIVIGTAMEAPQSTTDICRRLSELFPKPQDHEARLVLHKVCGTTPEEWGETSLCRVVVDGPYQHVHRLLVNCDGMAFFAHNSAGSRSVVVAAASKQAALGDGVVEKDFGHVPSMGEAEEWARSELQDDSAQVHDRYVAGIEVNVDADIAGLFLAKPDPGINQDTPDGYKVRHALAAPVWTGVPPDLWKYLSPFSAWLRASSSKDSLDPLVSDLRAGASAGFIFAEDEGFAVHIRNAVHAATGCWLHRCVARDDGFSFAANSVPTRAAMIVDVRVDLGDLALKLSPTFPHDLNVVLAVPGEEYHSVEERVVRALDVEKVHATVDIAGVVIPDLLGPRPPPPLPPVAPPASPVAPAPPPPSHFKLVPPKSSLPRPTMSEAMNGLFKRWIERGGHPLPWELVYDKLKVCRFTQGQELTDRVRTRLREHGGQSLILWMCKEWPSSGATTILRTCAADLAEYMPVLWLTDAPISEFEIMQTVTAIGDACGRAGRGVVAVDDHINDAVLDSILRAITDRRKRSAAGVRTARSDAVVSMSLCFLRVTNRRTSSALNGWASTSVAVTPFLANDDITSLHRVLVRADTFEKRVGVIGRACDEATLSSPTALERHIYIPILAATRGLASGIVDHVRKVLDILKDRQCRQLRESLYAIAVGRALSTVRVGIPSSELNSIERDARADVAVLLYVSPVFTDGERQETLCFSHELLARVFVREAPSLALEWPVSSDGIVGWPVDLDGLQRAWDVVKGAALPGPALRGLVQALFNGRHPGGGRFSALLWPFVLEKRDAVVEEMVASVRDEFLKEHADVVLSRYFRVRAHHASRDGDLEDAKSCIGRAEEHARVLNEIDPANGSFKSTMAECLAAKAVIPCWDELARREWAQSALNVFEELKALGSEHEAMNSVRIRFWRSHPGWPLDRIREEPQVEEKRDAWEVNTSLQ